MFYYCEQYGIEVTYDFISENEIEFKGLYINDSPVAFDLETFLIDNFGSEWEEIILKGD